MSQSTPTMTPMVSLSKPMCDALIEEIFARARKDSNLLLLSADPGVAALNAFRAELPDQSIFPSLCGENLIDRAADLARVGKNVFAYTMASSIDARCYERLKAALGAMNKPVTVVSVGVGLGCEDARSKPCFTEDIACLRSLPNVEIWTPCDEESTRAITLECCDRPAFRLIRLEHTPLANVYQGNFRADLAAGFSEVAASNGDAVILASGYMLHRALAVRDELRMEGLEVAVADVFRIKPIASRELTAYLGRFSRVITLEEQCLAGGFGSAIAETLMDAATYKPMLRLGLPDRSFVERGGRDHLLEKFGLGVSTVAERITNFVTPTCSSRSRPLRVPTFTSY